MSDINNLNEFIVSKIIKYLDDSKYVCDTCVPCVSACVCDLCNKKVKQCSHHQDTMWDHCGVCRRYVCYTCYKSYMVSVYRDVSVCKKCDQGKPPNRKRRNAVYAVYDSDDDSINDVYYY